MKDCCDNCKEGKECCSANEANTKSIDGKALYDFLQKRFKMSKSKAIATMKKHKMDLSFLKKESVTEAVKDPKLKVGQKIRHKSDPRRLYILKKITHGNSGIPEDPAGTSYMFVAPGNRKEYHTKKTWAQAIKKGWIIPESVSEGGPGSGKPANGSSKDKDKEEMERKAKEQAKKDMEDEFDFDFDESVNEGQRAFLAYRKMKEGIEDTIKGIRILRGHIDNAPYNKKFSLMTSELYKFQIDMEKKLHKFIPQISKLSKDKLLESWSTGLERYKVTLENGKEIDVKVKEDKGLDGLEELLKKEGLKFDKITKKASRPTLSSESVNEDNFRSRAIDDIDEIHTSVKYLASKIAKEDRKHGTKATREYIKFYKQHFMKFYTGVTKSAFNLLADGVIKEKMGPEQYHSYLQYVFDTQFKTPDEKKMKKSMIKKINVGQKKKGLPLFKESVNEAKEYKPEKRRKLKTGEVEVMKGKGSRQKWFYLKNKEEVKQLIKLGRNSAFPTGITNNNSRVKFDKGLHIKESVNEAVEPKGNMAKIAKVVKDKQATKLSGVMIDMQSANLLMKLWDAVSDKDKEKMNKMNARLLTTVIKKLWSRINLKLPI